jgi:hypothetical protein
MKNIVNSAIVSERNYAPAAIGNGDLSLLIDWHGAQLQQEHCGMLPNIRRAGYRYDSQRGQLIPFGYFTQVFPGSDKVKAWNQSLDTSDGIVCCDCAYENGTNIKSTVFCHLEQNVVAIHKKIESQEAFSYCFNYHFAPKHALVSSDGSGKIEYELDEMRHYQGYVRISADIPLDFSCNDGIYTATTNAREFTIFLSFDQEVNGTFNELMASSKAAWARYWNESYIKIPSEKIQCMYDTAQYHLRISSTRWSIPTGIYDSHWHGLYFAFDEYFNFMALLSSGHMDDAAKVPHYRYEILDSAIYRICGNREPLLNAASYPWQSNEIGQENASRGFWCDHIFQASNIALTAWEYYRYSGDKELLRKELYPVIRASCEWLRLFHIIKNDDRKAIIHICTDLERLRPGKVNPFMTSCSVIATLEATVKAAKELDVDDDRIEEWQTLASELRSTLPRENGRYVPYAGCHEHSIAQLAGIYPYAVLSSDDPLQLAAIEDYCSSKSSCGNMYQMGKGVCGWYLCWEAITMARLGKGDRALELLEEVASQSGWFGEMFEIYEMGIRPWFTTAEGKFVQAVNELFVQCNNAETFIRAAIPASWTDYSFKLQGLSGNKIEITVKENQIISKENYK